MSEKGQSLYRACRQVAIRQKKTGRPVRFELSHQTRQAIDDYLKAATRGPASSCSPAIAVPTAA